MTMNYAFQPTCQIVPEILNGIYKDAFGFKNDCVLVEIGAHDGWHWSNTWGLAKIGWRAIYIEPVPKLYSQCKKTYAKHGNVTVRKCCIGPTNSRATLGMGEYGACLESKTDRFCCQQFTLDKFLMRERVPRLFD